MGYWRIGKGDWGLGMAKNKGNAVIDINPQWTKKTFAKSIDVSGKSLLEAANFLRAKIGKEIYEKQNSIHK